MGGRSSEHEVSLNSARSVIEGLDPDRYEVVPLEIPREGPWHLTAEQVPEPVDLVLLSHFHGDHFDQVAERELDKSLPIVTTPEAAEALRQRGFVALHPLATWAHWLSTTYRRSHGAIPRLILRCCIWVGRKSLESCSRWMRSKGYRCCKS